MGTPIIKKNYKRYCKAFINVVSSKPQYHIWIMQTLLPLFNKQLPQKKRLSEKQMGYFIKSQKEYIIFKNAKIIYKGVSKTAYKRYIFIKKKGGKQNV